MRTPDRRSIRRPTVGVAAATVVWVVVLVVLNIGSDLLDAFTAAHSDPEAGADIGLGLLEIAGIMIVSSAGGMWDGWRHPANRLSLVIRWAVVGLLAGIGAAVYRSFDDGNLGVSDALANFAASTYLSSVLITVAAVGAGAVASSVRTVPPWMKHAERR